MPRSSTTSTPLTPRSQDHDRPGGGGGGGITSSRPVDRSCTTCHRRKVRCDKRSPCAACQRGGRVCIYPDPSEQLPRRKPRKSTIADVASRISDLEKSLVDVQSQSRSQSAVSGNGSGSRERPEQRRTFAGDGTTWRTGEAATLPVSVTGNEPARRDGEVRGSQNASEILVRNGTSSQYVNELAIARMIEADRERHSLLSTPQDTSPAQAQDSPFSLMGILSHPSAFANDAHGHLDKLVGMKLWQIFVANIDPFAKVLHIPTAEVDIFTAINQPETVSRDTMALLQAIYFVAITSMEADDVSKMLGMDPVSALAIVKTRFQRALAEADILETPTVTLLQALAIFLHMVPSWNTSRGSWILNGLALRLALSLGLHTDGSKLGLSPFESELRRRVWWNLFARDFRSLEDHGISPLLHLPRFCTLMPLNVEDSDLYPDMVELPPPRRGWTRMTFPLIVAETSQALNQTFPTPERTLEPGIRKAHREETFRQLREKLGGYFDGCHPAVPLQKFTLQVGRAILHKVDLISRQQLANIETPNDRDSFATEENMDSACTCIEMNMEAWDDELLRPHRWSQRVHPQYQMILYVLWHLCIRPEGPQVDRAWHAVDAMFRLEAQRLSHNFAQPSLNLTVLQRLKTRAETIRDALQNGGQSRSSEVEVDAGHEPMQDQTASTSPAPAMGSGNVEFSIEGDFARAIDGIPLPDWNMLVGDLSLDFNGFPGMLYTVPYP